MTPKAKAIFFIGIGVAIAGYCIKNSKSLPINDKTRGGAALAIPVGLAASVIAYLSTKP